MKGDDDDDDNNNDHNCSYSCLFYLFMHDFPRVEILSLEYLNVHEYRVLPTNKNILHSLIVKGQEHLSICHVRFRISYQVLSVLHI